MEFENNQGALEEEESQMESLILNDNTNNGGDPLSNGHPLSPPAEIPTSHDHTVNDPLSMTSSPNPNSSFNSFLEPPSYADAVFRSFDDGHNSNNNKIVSTSSASATSSSASSSGEYLKISVTDPQKSQDVVGNSLVPGGGSYVTYLIATWTNLPEFNGTEFSVRRRFKDVVTLSDRLSEAYRGYFIPLRPDKSVVESQVMQKHEFVENRRVALEKYLRKLAEHPVIKRSEELRVFLQVQGKLPLVKTTDVASRMLDGAVKLPKQLFGESVVSAAVDPSEVVQPAKGGRDLLRLFKELRQSVTNDWGGAKPLVVEEDKEFLDKRKKLQDFETELTNVSQQCITLSEINDNFLVDSRLVPRELKKISSSLPKQARSAVVTNVECCAICLRIQYILETHCIIASSNKRRMDKLHEYLGVMLAVNNAYADRSNALLTVQTLLSELSNLNSRIEKLEAAASKIFGGDRSRVRKIEELKETMKVTEDAKSCAVKEYERIKENNKNELERLDKERHDDFFGMLKGFVVNQAGYAEKMASVWETVAKETSGYAKSS
ncbi:Phox homologous domain-containing protein [Artemisia annua]|uniref:Phox homologous domain-containing protein n=1 Tax=Artemisia annua TaxID=35608 RepID=A0A2U1PF64_ARTAN|nr:Phox homologous domain-containing protein [Artemisia annua]